MALAPFTSSLLLLATGQPIVWHTAGRPSPEKKIEYQAVLGIEAAANVYTASTWCGRRGNVAARSVIISVLDFIAIILQENSLIGRRIERRRMRNKK